MQRLLKELSANTGYGIKAAQRSGKVDKGRPASFNTEPHVTLGFNFMG